MRVARKTLAIAGILGAVVLIGSCRHEPTANTNSAPEANTNSAPEPPSNSSTETAESVMPTEEMLKPWKGDFDAMAERRRFIVNQYFKDAQMDSINKLLFAFASYNAGPARVAQLRRQAQSRGLDPNRWFRNVEYVAAKEIGQETVQYVSNIYKYYVAYRQVLGLTEKKNAA